MMNFNFIKPFDLFRSANGCEVDNSRVVQIACRIIVSEIQKICIFAIKTWTGRFTQQQIKPSRSLTLMGLFALANSIRMSLRVGSNLHQTRGILCENKVTKFSVTTVLFVYKATVQFNSLRKMSTSNKTLQNQFKISELYGAGAYTGLMAMTSKPGTRKTRKLRMRSLCQF